MRAVGGDDGKRRLLVKLAQFACDIVASQPAADDDDRIHGLLGGITLSLMQRPAKAMPHCTAPYHAASSTISSTLTGRSRVRQHRPSRHLAGEHCIAHEFDGLGPRETCSPRERDAA